MQICSRILNLSTIRFTTAIALFIFGATAVHASGVDSSVHIYNNETNGKYLKTVQLRRTDLALAPPMILLGSSDELELSFDDIRAGAHSYSYTFTHCDQKWNASGLDYFDYIDGFEKNTIDQYAFSFATVQPYTHYKIDFPNDNAAFKLSGNYIIQVWEDEKEDTPVITRRFFVREDVAPVDAQVIRPNAVPYRNEFQQLSFTVNASNSGSTNPYDEIRVTLMQNNCFENALYDLKPDIIDNNVMHYTSNDIVFPAGKEYRRFDTKTLRFQSDRVKKITKGENGYDVYINVDDSRIYQQYFYEQDMNGNFVISATDFDQPETEGDYATVHFTLQYPYYITSGDFYVYGGLSDYAVSDAYKMTYNFDKQQYEATVFLKQGYYNYMYVYVDKEKPTLDFTYAEGNYYETENEYMVLAYLHDYEKNYDRLIGSDIVNSVRK